ncbi:MAG: hypothetical protein EOO85_00020 [Pedobacter sp.]|nr:MAG: hypothetical protein EOO85_00020 [Pedobacter sp.]
MISNYDLLVSKINEFTQKFYLNKLLRGIIYALSSILGLFLMLFLFSYYLNPGISTKTVLFFSFLIVSAVLIYIWVIVPGLSYFRLAKTLTLDEAAKLIGNHFFHVKDKLLNTLQLKALADKSPENNLLILAGIDQKITELKPVPFAQAIRLTENKRYIKYVVFPLSIIFLIGIIAPAVLREGTNRFVQFDKEILPIAPFEFNLVNKQLKFTQGDDATITLKLTGDEIPQEVYVTDGLNTYKLEKTGKVNFRYVFKNIQKGKQIQFSAGGFNSKTHTLTVNPRPSILSMSATLVYPSYLRKATEQIQNAGDMLIPEGTLVTWAIKAEHTSAVTFSIAKEQHELSKNQDEFSYSRRIGSSVSYQINPKNEFVSTNDSLLHQLTVIKDEFPGIAVEETPDSISSKALYFSGNISDDHGFSSLSFNIIITGSGGNKQVIKKPIALKSNSSRETFFYVWNMANVPLQSGQSMEYYFEVADNDAVNGLKKAKSEIKSFTPPTPQQITEKLNKGSANMKQEMEKAIKLAAEVEKDSKKLGAALLDKKQLSFEDKKQIEQLLEKQKQLESKVGEIKKQNQKNTVEKQENNLLKDELAEKQKQIDDLFNNALDDKTKSLLQKLQQMMDDNNKDQAQNELSKMQMDNKSLKNELDRILELYKQLEFEQNLKNNIDQLKELAKKQKDLAQQSKSKDSKAEDLKKAQDQLTSEFKDLKKELESIDKKNQELERPNAFKKPEQESKNVDNKQQESKQELDKGDKKDAAESQDQAAQEMQKMAQKMEEMQNESEETSSKVNAEELRQLLENLLKTSFDQEKVMLALKNMNFSDPLYTANVQKQRGIKDNLKTISDSLFSLSKRVPQIESMVNDEMQKINLNVDKSLENLGERNTSIANRNQQYTMTSINNLSLMLSEALSQLQNAKKNSKGGGKSKGSMSELQQMQDKLNKNMQDARQQMQKSGNQGKVPKGQMSQEFSKMAQQQQMIREAMQKLNREQNKDGKNGMGDLNKVIEDMKSTENDLVNKRIEEQTLDRQKKILDKMLNAEKAEREEEEDVKREAKAAKEFPPSYKNMLEKFKAKQQSETEWIQKLPPNMNFYYKDKITTYFKLLNLPK